MLKNLLIWIAAIALSATSYTTALGGIAKNRSPDFALSLFPTNGFAAEAKAAKLAKASVAKNLGGFPDKIDRSLNMLALQAFKSEPIVPDAIAVIALSQAEVVRRDLMQTAFQLSRRQQLTSGWLIFDSGKRDDIPAILNHYDTILRTNISSRDVVINGMANALANENFVQPFASLLSKHPPWADRFWEKIVLTPAAIGNASRLREILYEMDEKVTGEYRDQDLIIALVKGEQFNRAEELYMLMNPQKSDSGILRNSTFQMLSKYPPIDWQLLSTGEYGANITEGILQFSAISNSGGLFARQLIKLPNAELELEVKLVDEVPLGANIFIELSCAESVLSKAQKFRLPLTRKYTSVSVVNSLDFCEYYWLDIYGFAKDDGFDFGIKSISIQPK